MYSLSTKRDMASAVDNKSTSGVTVEDDEYRRSRARRQSSKKYLRQYFGASSHTDISLAEIEKHGLCILLQSNLPLAHFLHFCLKSLNSENLFFYLEIEQFEEYRFNDVKAMKRTAMHLYDAFVKDGADFELNLPGEVRSATRRRIEEEDQFCFSNVREHAIALLEPCIETFMMSPEWMELKTVIEKTIPINSCMYSKELRNDAVNKLVDCLEELEAQKSLLATDRAAQRRVRLLREMLHDFCKTRLRCDFHDKVRKPEEEARNVI